MHHGVAQHLAMNNGVEIDKHLVRCAAIVQLHSRSHDNPYPRNQKNTVIGRLIQKTQIDPVYNDHFPA